MKSSVFVIDTDKRPVDPVHPGQARRLMREGKAARFMAYPFTIVMKDQIDTDPEPLRLKIDPGSKVSGISVVNDMTGKVVYAIELEHRGWKIKDALASRRALRRGRRNRKTRYRAPRFMNRTRKDGWLPPSLESRIDNVCTWINRIKKIAPISAISMELVRFDMQKMDNAEISGVGYQQGTLQGYEVREYLLQKWGRKCAYCGKQDIPLEIEHIQPKSKGGSDRVSNLAIACRPCNQKKGNQPIEDFLKKKPEILRRIKAQAKAPLKDAAAVNATRWALFRRIKDNGIPVECGSGGLTKFNRTQRGFPKTHWLDAVCVGKSTPEKINIDGIVPLQIKAMGHGLRQRVSTDKYGFPKCYRARAKFSRGFQTGDIVCAINPSGKFKGKHHGRVVIRHKGSFALGKAGVNPKNCRKIQSADGYGYSFTEREGK